LTGQNGTCTTAAPIVFRTNIPGPFGELITVSVANEHYQVGWKTSVYNLPNYSFWRVHVRTEVGGGTTFGFIDLWLAKAANELKKTPAGSVGVLNTSNVPIKFRIEKGALCNDAATCVEASFGAGGGTFTTPTADAGFRAPANALDATEVVNLVVERYHGPDPCLPVFDPQYEGCYRYYTEPHVENFDLPVILGQCLDLAGQAVYNQLSLWKWDEVNPSSLVELPSVDVSDFVTCPDDLASANHKTGFFASASKLLKPLAGFLVKPAYAKRAGPPPLGAGALDLSRVGPRRQLSINKESGDNQTALAGSSVNVSVKVTSTKTGEPIAGVAIDFTALTGGSATTPVNTDVLGIASSTWTLGAVGANSLRSDGNNPRPIWPGQPGIFGNVTFNATGLAGTFVAFFQSPIASNPGPNVNGLPVTVVICELVGEACGTTLANLPATLSQDGTYYQADWVTPVTLDPSKSYRIRVLVANVHAESIKVLPSGSVFQVGSFQFTAGQTVPVTFRVQSF
jgi:hypothetical protein